MKKLVNILALIVLLSGCALQSQPLAQSGSPTPKAPEPPDPSAAPTTKGGGASGESDLPETVRATITMESGGVMELELYPRVAPQSVCNFVYLAREGFYDGLIFHRVIEGFMIQGGDPTGTGGGGPGYGIKGEFALNGFDNALSHERGVVSMARQGDPAYDSAGSQFFIVHEDSLFLDGSYAAFGKVVSGMEVVDEIVKAPKGAGDRPKKDIAMKSVTIDGPELPEPERLKK